MKVAIVHSGGYGSPDDEDTLHQLRELSTNLCALGYETAPIPFQDSMGGTERALRDYAPSFVFNLVEAAKKTDRLSYTAPALFDFMGLPYTGCPASSLALMSSKTAQKKLMRMAGLPTPELNAKTGPFIVKTDTENASIGLGAENVVDTLEKAYAIIEEKKRKTGIKNWFIERYIDGREFNIAMIEEEGGPRVLPHAEINFIDFPENVPKIMDYDAKWNEDENSPEYRSTMRHFDFPETDTPLLQKLSDLSLRCWDLFSLKGATRVDFRVDQDGNPWILEVNPNPCLLADLGLMAAAAQAGLTPQDVVQRLISCLNQ